METYEYHQLLKHLYFEGYVDSYKEAEDLIEELTDDEFDFLYEEVFGIDEGKVPWNDPEYPLQSGWTPAEKNRAKRNRTGVEDPNNRDISDNDMRRYGAMKQADDDESSKAPKPKKNWIGRDKPIEHPNLHQFKKNRKIEKTGAYTFNSSKKYGGEHTMGQGRRAVGSKVNSSTAQTPIHSDDTRRRTSRRWGGPNPRSNSTQSDGPRAKMVKVGRNWQKQMEDYDFNNLILNHLLDEGYANDVESAEVILENMSEGWKTDVLKSAAKGTKKLAKKASKTKLAKKANKFLTRTALGAIGVPLIS